MNKRLILAEALRQNPFHGFHVFVGLDAFIDQIYHVVKERRSACDFDRMAQMSEFALQVQSAAGKSANVELLLQRKKMGGNATLLGCCSSTLGASVTALVPVGLPVPNTVFSLAAPQVNWLSIGEPGLTDALEFQDGKIMLGNLGTLGNIGLDTLRNTIGLEQFDATIRQNQLIVLANWTMILGMGEIFTHIAQMDLHDFTGLFFMDLADPQKRAPADLRTALFQIAAIGKKARVVLGLNLSEAEQVLTVLDSESTLAEHGPQLQNASCRISKALGVGVVIHATKIAAAYHDSRGNWVHGPFCANPLITTGAGDHFNGGFATAYAAGFSLEHALLCGVACSGFYVRKGRAPTVDDLAQLLCDSIEFPRVIGSDLSE